MSVDTYCLDFHVAPCLDESVYVRDVATIATCVAELLQQDCLEQGCISSVYSYSAIYSGPKDSVFTIKHYFREGLITVTIECFRVSIEDALFRHYEEIEILTRHITKTLDADGGTSLPAIRRCLTKSPYLRTSDDRLQQYRWEALLFCEQTRHQLVEIFKTTDYGNVLVLDGFVNLAESDLVYTHSLMCQGKQDYKDKEILILGGGDGGLLHELLKEQPKFVTMVDIDDAVIRGCGEHMRSVCGDVLDKSDGDNYKIIVDDAFVWLKKYEEEGKQFDVIFGDLTDIPVHEQSSTWDFVRAVLRMSLSILPVGGKYMTHCNGKNSQHALSVFESQVKKLGYPLDVTTSEAYVPSFQETWVFYQLTRKEGVVNQVVNGHAVKEEEGVEKVNGTASEEEKKTIEKEDEAVKKGEEAGKKEAEKAKKEGAKEAKKEGEKEAKKEGEKEAKKASEGETKAKVTPDREVKGKGEKKEAKSPTEKKEGKAGLKSSKEKINREDSGEKAKPEKNGKKKDAK